MAARKKEKIVEIPVVEVEPRMDTDAHGSGGQAEACPTYTLSADSRFDVLALIGVLRVAREWGAYPEKIAELERVVREFELYEEKWRR